MAAKLEEKEIIDIRCVCGAVMLIKNPQKEYSHKNTWCDNCKMKFDERDNSYHCVNKQNAMHPSGYDYCIQCAYILYEKQRIRTNPGDKIWKEIFKLNLDSLKKRLIYKHKHYSNHGDNVIFEYKRFLYLKIFKKDIYSKIYSPSWIIDELWHLHILDSQNYFKICQYLLTINIKINNQYPNINYKFEILHHNADGDLNTNLRNQRYLNTLNDYKLIFHQNAPKTYWPNLDLCQYELQNFEFRNKFGGNINVLLKRMNDESIHLYLNPKDNIHSIKLIIKEKVNIDVNKQRIIFAGMQLDDFQTVSDYNIQNGSIMYLIRRLSKKIDKQNNDDI